MPMIYILSFDAPVSGVRTVLPPEWLPSILSALLPGTHTAQDSRSSALTTQKTARAYSRYFHFAWD